EPEADLRLAGGDGAFERVGWGVHRAAPRAREPGFYWLWPPWRGPNRLGARGGEPLARNPRPDGLRMDPRGVPRPPGRHLAPPHPPPGVVGRPEPLEQQGVPAPRLETDVGRD